MTDGRHVILLIHLYQLHQESQETPSFYPADVSHRQTVAALAIQRGVQKRGDGMPATYSRGEIIKLQKQTRLLWYLQVVLPKCHRCQDFLL